jgi:hypothetical protein
MWLDGIVQLIELRKWAIRSDPDLTREAYALLECGGAESCGCEECFNFAAARHLVYDPDLLELLEWLGIDPQLEAEVRRDRSLGCGRHTYTATFYLVGEIASGPSTTVAHCGGNLVYSREVAGAGAVGFSADAHDAPDAFRGLPVVCLEVCVEAPWISNAPEPH